MTELPYESITRAQGWDSAKERSPRSAVFLHPLLSLHRDPQTPLGSSADLLAALPQEPGEAAGGRMPAELKPPFHGTIQLFRVPGSLQSGSNFPVIGKVTVTALSFVCSDT